MIHRCGGLTLIELMISVTLSLSLTLIFISLHVQSTEAADRQQLSARQLENKAALIHLLSHSVRDALYTISSAGDVSVFNNNCAGITLDQHCQAPVTAWRQGQSGTIYVGGALADSMVLQVQQSCCADTIADLFYLARRSGAESNPLSLYRRRVATDGRLTTAVELVEGVAKLQYQFILQSDITGDLALVDQSDVTDWWQLKAVRVLVILENSPDEFGFTITGRQWQQAVSRADQ